MEIDNRLIKEYLVDEPITAKSHWLYAVIEPEKILFEEPRENKKEISELEKTILTVLKKFKPVNEELVTRLFPTFYEQLANIELILSIGVPAPYDTFTRVYQGEEYLILDLARLASYGLTSKQITNMLRELITHEVIHLCLHVDYPNAGETYQEKLNYLAFDEGFAHLLSHQDKLEDLLFDETLKEYYEKSNKRFVNALQVTDKVRQGELLSEAVSGPYWEKFGAIFGMLRLLQERDDLVRIYQAGPDKFIELKNIL